MKEISYELREKYLNEFDKSLFRKDLKERIDWYLATLSDDEYQIMSMVFIPYKNMYENLEILPEFINDFLSLIYKYSKAKRLKNTANTLEYIFEIKSQIEFSVNSLRMGMLKDSYISEMRDNLELLKNKIDSLK